MPMNPGDILGNHYRIEAEIGRGAYGRVYRARDTKLDRPVAIKELAKGADELGSSQFADYVRRFEREARVQAGFNHPNIVHVYELIQESADRLYLVMEYVDGENLRDALARRGPLPVDEAVRITSDLLGGLAAVHADPRDIVHRDIKPSNVLLTKDGHAKVADFGLAQVGDESLRSEGGKPHPGTALYMSPEQETTSAYLYPASDLFSVGCLLFEMLAGMPYRRAKKSNRMPSHAYPVLADVLTRALSETARDRFENAEEMLAALSRSWASTRTDDGLEGGTSFAITTEQSAAAAEPAALREPREQAGFGGLSLTDTDVITPENTHRITTLRIIGYGYMTGAAMSSDGRLIAVSTSAGIELLDGATLSDVRWLDTGSSAISVAFASDSTLLAAGLRNGHLCLWRTADGKLLRRWPGHDSPVSAVAFSGRDRLLASGARETTARTWRIPDAAPMHLLEGHDTVVHKIASAPDGSIVVTVDGRFRRRFWRTADGKLERVIGDGSQPIFDVAFFGDIAYSRDGQVLALPQGPKALQLCQSSDGTELRALRRPDGVAPAIGQPVFSPDGRVLATLGPTAFCLWQVSDGTLLHQISVADIKSIVGFSSDGERLVVATRAGKAPHHWGLELWRIRDQARMRQVNRRIRQDSSRLTLDTGTELLAAWDPHDSPRSWRLGSSEPVEVPIPAGTASIVEFSPDDRFLAAVPDGRSSVSFRLWRHSQVKEQWELACEVSENVMRERYGRWEPGWLKGLTLTPARGVAFAPDRAILATASENKSVQLWSTSGDLIRKLEGQYYQFGCVAFSPDGRILAAGADDGTVWLWRMQKKLLQRSLVRNLEMPRAPGEKMKKINQVAFSPNSALLTAWGEDLRTHLWRVRDGKLLHTWQDDHRSTQPMLFSPAGDVIAGLEGRHACLWRLPEVTLQHTLTEHSDDIEALAFAPDGATIASGAKDGSVRLWRAADGALLSELLGHGDSVVGMSFGLHGRLLITSSKDLTIRLWGVPQGKSGAGHAV